MARTKEGTLSKYTTPYGRKVINLNITPEFEERLRKEATKKSLTRPAYIIMAVNKQLEEDERRQTNE